MLYDAGLLRHIFRNGALAGAEYIDGHGHKDNFYHTLQVLDNVADRSLICGCVWAAILHDIAKPVTKRYEPPHGGRFTDTKCGSPYGATYFCRFKIALGDKFKICSKPVALHLRLLDCKRRYYRFGNAALLFDAGRRF